MGESDEGCYESVMPIVLAQSNGGPFDDAAVVAGMACGALDYELKVAASLGAVPRERYIDSCLIRQVDLIAMRHGYTLQLGDLDDSSGWQVVSFDWSSTSEA